LLKADELLSSGNSTNVADDWLKNGCEEVWGRDASWELDLREKVWSELCAALDGDGLEDTSEERCEEDRTED
jgi:hypothetical protein